MTPRGHAKTIKQTTKLLDKDIIMCFANSKFLVIDEMTDANFLSQLKYDEFLEFIARSAMMAKFDSQARPPTPPPEVEGSESEESVKEENV